MKPVLVLGGYGGFGSRLCRRLAKDGWAVLVAGRNIARAKDLAASLPNAEGLIADRTGNLVGALRETGANLLIDAAGPFQESDYRVVEACIAEGVHYLDLADGRDFVCGIGALDEQARAAGITAISGASSVPALSGAVVSKLSADMDNILSMEMSISASNRATAGASVAAAILSYAGQEIQLWDGQRWTSGTGLQDVKRECYAVAGKPSLHRYVALADVPDLAILPELPGRPSVVFRAGPEFFVHVLGLWLMSWPVKWGWLDSLLPMKDWLYPLHRLTGALGSDASAMAVDMTGMVDGQMIQRRWTLIAQQGDGPEIPTLAAQLLARDISNRTLASGARHAGSELTLDRFRELFADLAITEQTSIQAK
jgi:hypothetical protein